MLPMHLVAASEKKNAVKALGNAKHALHRGRLAKAMASMHTATKAIRIARRATHRMKAWVREHWTYTKRMQQARRAARRWMARVEDERERVNYWRMRSAAEHWNRQRIRWERLRREEAQQWRQHYGSDVSTDEGLCTTELGPPSTTHRGPSSTDPSDMSD
jgi:hypothetical protein